MKTCPDCNLLKPLNAFYTHKSRKLGVSHFCKECTKRRVTEWTRGAGKERAKINKRKYRVSPAGKAADLRYASKESTKAQVKQRAEANPYRHRNLFESSLRQNYALSLVEYAWMIHSQNRKCAACTEALELDKHTHVDHCHKTGEIRGVLCRGCNTALGGARDRVDVLESLILYLRRGYARKAA